MKYFLTNQNKVLTKEQIYRSIWGDNVVDDNHHYGTYPPPAHEN